MGLKRTNIYLEDDQLDVLKHLAATEGTTSAELIRQAVDAFLSVRLSRQDLRERWGQQLDRLVSQVRDRLPAGVRPEDLEAEITAASHEVRSERLAGGC